MSIKYNEHLKRASLNRTEIIKGFLNRTNIQANRQALATLIAIDKVVLRSKNHETAFLYNPKSKELETDNLKDFIDTYIFPAISNKQDVKAIGSYFKEVKRCDVRNYNLKIRGKTAYKRKLIHEQVLLESYNKIYPLIKDLEHKQDTLIKVYNVIGFNLKKGNDEGIKEVV